MRDAALASGSTEGRLEADDEGGYFLARLTPGYLQCRVCDLELDGEDELRIAGVQDSWDIEGADSADYYEPGRAIDW